MAMLLAGGWFISQARAVNITSTDLYTLAPPAGFDGFYFEGSHFAADGQMGGTAGGYYLHAVLWTNTGTAIDLNPAGASISQVFAIRGTQQVGNVRGQNPGDDFHAALWNGSAASFVDLNPYGANNSQASDTNGTQQVGRFYGQVTGYSSHAALWNGTAASFVDLHPAGFDQSVAYGSHGTQQVGFADNHAMVWNGTADSAVDLNPEGFFESFAYGTDGIHQVGNAFHLPQEGLSQYSFMHAMLWSGTADSAIDLHSFLPADFKDSYAYSIEGNTIYGYARKPIDDTYHAIAWTISSLPGDTNGDGVVDVSDYNNVINNFGSTGLGDTNSDGVIDITDYNDVINNFGASAVVTFIPEPGSLSLLAIGAMALLRRKRLNILN